MAKPRVLRDGASPAAATAEFILYACPGGELAAQIRTYLAQVRVCCGLNQAHRFMPHCTLTGFFHDAPASATAYGDQLNHLLTTLRPSQPTVQVTALTLRPDWHGLELAAPWLYQLALAFREQAQGTALVSPIRPKHWLHLSLAYGFAPHHAAALQALAQAHIAITSPVTWELRFYQRCRGNTWICHRRWPLMLVPGAGNKGDRGFKL